MSNVTPNNVVTSNPSVDVEYTGVLDDLYSGNPLEEDFRPNTRHDNDIESKDDQRAIKGTMISLLLVVV